jgi:hypothetical protein
MYLVALVALALALLLAHMLVWSLWGPAVEADPTGPLAWRVGLAHVAVLLLATGLALVGWRPALAVACDDAAGMLHLRQGRHRLALRYDAIAEARLVTPLHVHRHLQRRDDVTVFRGRLTGAPLLHLRLAHGPSLILGLDAGADLDALRARVEDRREDAEG